MNRTTQGGYANASHRKPSYLRRAAGARQIVDATVLDSSRSGDIVLDPFLGSGTTLMAAERTRRRCHGIELDPLYVDVIVRRWQAYTGASARHASTGASFDEISASRAAVSLAKENV